jgi:polyphosphate kinase
VERFILDAADDPDVISIKLTLYRSGDQSRIVDGLMRAAQAGKEVAVFVELKARFDEERNIHWARKLERAGIHVVYGLVRLKTHAKTTLVVRREGDTVRRYVHIGTGNYNAATAKFYTDLGLLSCRQKLGADLSDLFNELTGSSRPPQSKFRRLLVAPKRMRKRFLKLIEREAEHARSGRGGQIRVKLNGLADTEIIGALYSASQAGVEIDLIVRGICTLRPGVPDLSDRIRVISILGRFLEHARVYYFANGGEPEFYIGSADWRPRNLKRRVEVVTPVPDPDARARLEEILDRELGDPFAWHMNSDGSYSQRPVPIGVDQQTAQDYWVARLA